MRIEALRQRMQQAIWRLIIVHDVHKHLTLSTLMVCRALRCLLGSRNRRWSIRTARLVPHITVIVQLCTSVTHVIAGRGVKDFRGVAASGNGPGKTAPATRLALGSTADRQENRIPEATYTLVENIISAAPPSLRNEDEVLCSPTKAVVYARKQWLRGKTVNQLSLSDTVGLAFVK